MEPRQQPQRRISRSLSRRTAGRRPPMKSSIPVADVGYSHNGKTSTRQQPITSEFERWHEVRHAEPLTAHMVRGALAGLIATVPMSLTMIVMHQYLPSEQRHPLPPRQISDKVSHHLRMDRLIDDAQARTLVSHFAYGAAAGAIYGGMVRQPPVLSTLSGVGFGLAVWAGSYMGWLPALGILSPATEQPAHRNLLMIIAHVVWGAVTGVLTSLLQRKTDNYG